MNANDIDQLVVNAERQKYKFFDRLHKAEARVAELEAERDSWQNWYDGDYANWSHEYDNMRHERDAAWGLVERMARAMNFDEGSETGS